MMPQALNRYSSNGTVSDTHSNCKRKREPLTPIVPNVASSSPPLASRKRQRAAPGDDNKRKSTLHHLPDILIRALKANTLPEIHPSAYARANRLIVPSISLPVYNRARVLIPALTSSKRPRLEYASTSTLVSASQIRRGGKGNLIVTMPTRIHELMKAFASEIKAQMLAVSPATGKSFVPGSWQRDRILETGSATITLEHNKKTMKYEPDASLAIDINCPFLVLEVAVTQDARAAKKKAQDYILGSNGGIPYVMVIVVTRRNRLRRRTVEDKSARSDEVHSVEIQSGEESRAANLHNDGNDQAGVEQDLREAGGRTSPSDISTFTETPSDLSQWAVFPLEQPPPRSLSQDERASNSNLSQSSKSSTASPQSASSASIRLPPLLSTILDTSDTLRPGDKVHLSVFKSSLKPSPRPASASAAKKTARHEILTLRALMEDIEIYPCPLTRDLGFTISWADIARSAPNGAGPPLTIDLAPLSLLAQRLAIDDPLEDGSRLITDDGFRPLTPFRGTDKEVLLTSSSLEADEMYSGGTVPSSVERRLDPDYKDSSLRTKSTEKIVNKDIVL